jgi:alkyl-hydroperoxide reductase/thiol specific antioxidant family protein
MDPRTFLPPRSVATADLPRPGQPAPPLEQELRGRPVVVAFLRHVGCPFAEATLRELRERAQGNPDVRFLAVSHAPDAATRRWSASVAGPPDVVELVIDERRALYGAWGLGRSSLSHFLGASSLRAVSQLARQGIRNRHPSGTRWQTAGTFAVDREGVVRWVHVPEHAGALADLDVAIAAARAG